MNLGENGIGTRMTRIGWILRILFYLIVHFAKNHRVLCGKKMLLTHNTFRIATMVYFRFVVTRTMVKRRSLQTIIGDVLFIRCWFVVDIDVFK